MKTTAVVTEWIHLLVIKDNLLAVISDDATNSAEKDRTSN